jgi:hypothetical protein
MIYRRTNSALLMVAFGVTYFCPIAISSAESPTSATIGALQAGFNDPPNSARPRVWWHWMNGNVTEDGIALDLAWMKRIGIGGVQNFDAALATPQIVSKRLVYMSPEWKAAFRFAVQRADQLGLEFGIAAAPGWSETGGPWVQPKDGMKKLVWSETTLMGGKRFNHQLALPPSVSGPYQEIAAPEPAPTSGTPPTFYKDAIVVAYREQQAKPLPRPPTVTANGAPTDAEALLDGKVTTGVPLPKRNVDGPGVVTFDYAQSPTISSAVIYVANLPTFSPTGPFLPRLEASDDGRVWRKLTDVPLTNVPTTVSFTPVTARHFRLVFATGKVPDHSGFMPGPGVDISGAAALKMGPAAPARLADFRLFSGPLVNQFEQKAGFAIASDYYGLDGSAGPEVIGVAPESVVDLTDRMTADGRLRWTPPAGRWKVLRLGYSLTGTTNHPATAEATGLEVDKYDGEAVAAYLNTYLGMFRHVTGDALIGAHGLGALVTDSTEIGASNWTPAMLAQFQRLRGYDPRPWIPALTGKVVGSRRQSDAFLYDFRRTLADLTASEHYGTVARVAHAQDLIVYGESLEGARTVASLGDDLEMRRFADVPMGALWALGNGALAPSQVADIRGAASIGHLYGRNFVAAESLTSMFKPWGQAPSDLQPIIDAAFVNGVNRPVIHTSVHQPVDDKIPGLSLSIFGQYFNRHETWAEMAKPWVDYIARNSFLLQQGRNVADVAYFYGEEAPVGVQASGGYFRDVPKHYAYDFVSPQAVLDEIEVDNGDIVSKGGARYKLIYLGGTSQRMTLPVLRRLAELAEAGATIVGDAPLSTPSLADDEAEFARLAVRLWAGGKATPIGRGRVFAGRDVEAALSRVGVAPDVSYPTMQPADIQFVHRRLEDGDLYFVDNRTAAAQHFEARFRVTGKAPEIWHADTGKTEPVSYRIEGGETVVPLDMFASESLFVVFEKSAAAPSRSISKPFFAKAGEIGGPWDVAFQPGRGAPATVRLISLGSLSEQNDLGIKYFSGVATYGNSFRVPPGFRVGQPLRLDLGRVGDVAEVRVNGKLAGIAWKAPYRLDIGALVQPGRNNLEIRVANLWVNRLIGDEQPGAQKIAFTSAKTYTSRAPLRPSGLIGPVTLLVQTEH